MSAKGIMVHWRYLMGSVHVRIDLGEKGTPGKNFGITLDMSFPAPNGGKEATPEQMEAWFEKADAFIVGDVAALLLNPPGVILGNYMSVINEEEPSKYENEKYRSVPLEGNYHVYCGQQLYEEYVRENASDSPLRRGGWPTPAVSG